MSNSTFAFFNDVFAYPFTVCFNSSIVVFSTLFFILVDAFSLVISYLSDKKPDKYDISDKEKSLADGAIKGLNIDANIAATELETVAAYYDIDLYAPVKKLSKDKLDIILYGSKVPLEFKYTSKNGNTRNTVDYYEGVVNNLERRYIETKSNWIREWIENYMVDTTCPKCGGARLRNEVLSVKVGNKNIYEICLMNIKTLISFFDKLKLNKEQQTISNLLLKEINNRL